MLAALLGWALSASKLRPLRSCPKHPLTILLLIWHVAVDITKSNIAVARIIWLGKHADATPGFLKIPLRIRDPHGLAARSEEHTSELQSLMRSSYAVFCLKKKKHKITTKTTTSTQNNQSYDTTQR